MIVADGLTKRYGDKTAVDGVSFTVQPGKVTGFLGPNGAGKSTTMRMIVGLDTPTAGRVTLDGRDYRSLRSPLTEVGILLDAKAVHTGRSAQNHLRAMAATHGIPRSRVDEVIEITGLQSVAKRRAGKFSLGMGQRLGIAAALLGDPRTLILDEPVNGLDPEGVRWVRQFVRAQAASGRTVLLSSHLMSEMALTADHVIVLGRGRVLADASIADLVSAWTRSAVTVRSPRAGELAQLVTGPDVTVTSAEAGLLDITGTTAAAVGEIAAQHQIPLHELTPRSGSLEDAYLALTEGSVEYRTQGAAS
ncbi:ABC transporter ATP-binding protein [Microbacterium oleivorans]|uniref:Putative ABC multidrug transporter ATP-binding protein n=1 Tax=Microbacterium oleivorans TaxID=273677 RepID=A0A031FZX2_9MICO|nr:ATP-binding cassette domain-containing protein [Microbacterium oleivorans]AZS43897.1 ABC transporter ATP-binding protein NatA [Microbacterium oleivorans]EZP29812.1 putative ABC multidrug transporter ATP-binding protein [Microbacterium oleivorans]THE07278.1 ATP-binding cassette domain-containing protein [Microbacterium oleivorans]